MLRRPIRIAIVNMLFFAVMLYFNYLYAPDVGDVANEQPALIQPSSYAFSIWGLIYTLLFIWIVKGFFVEGNRARVYQDTQLFIPINFLLNGAWIFTFTQQYILSSTVIIFLLLFSLMFIYKRIKRLANRNLFALIPFSIYIGWVSVASIVNVFTYFTRSDMTTLLGIGELGWTVIMLAAATILAVLFTWTNRDMLYSLVFIWSYLAIYTRGEEAAVSWAALIGLVILSVTVIMKIIFEMRKRGRIFH